MTHRPRRRPGRPLVVAAVLLVGAVACSDDGDAASDPASSATEAGPGTEAGGTESREDGDDGGTVFPGDEWETVDAATLGFDPDRLDELAAEAEAADSTCLMVVRDGRVAGEWYWGEGAPDAAREVFSVTKSFTSTLVGLAVADGDLDLADPVATHVPEWAGTDSEAVTVRNLVANDSGRAWSLAGDYGVLVAERDRSAYAVGVGQDDPPGETWVYNNTAIQVLSEVLEAATGVEPADYAAERILEPIGMDDSAMGLDGAGNTSTFMGLRSTCRDLARFGHLALNGGRWGDDQVVPAAWLDEATGAPSTDLNAAYGYLWWLNREGPIGGATQAVGRLDAAERDVGQLVEGAPEDRYWALGLGDQIVQVDPGSATVVVRMGPPNLGGGGGPEFDTADTSRIVDEALVDGGA